ncbi:type II toxin-antitoxin system RelE/ParE family toxin [Desulfobacula sp.]
MKKLMTKHFSKWVSKQKIHRDDLSLALTEVQDGNFEASLGGYIYKKRIKYL